MSKSSLKSLLSLTYIISHFGIIALVIWFRRTEKYDDTTIKSVLSVLSPLFTAYCIPMVVYIANRQHKTDSRKKVSRIRAFTVVFTSLLLILSLLEILIRQADTPDDIGSFVLSLGLIESLFSPYLVYLIGDLFEKPGTGTQKQKV